MKFVNVISLFVMSIFSGYSHAYSYSAPSEIYSVSVNDSHIRIRVNNMGAGGYEGCSDQNWFALPLDSPGVQEKYSAVLYGKGSSSKMHFEFNGCSGNYPKIRTVYICEQSNCQ